MDEQQKKAEENRRYRESHKDEIAKSKKEWREANRDKVLASKRQYRQTHKAEIREAKRKWEKRYRQSNPWVAGVNTATHQDVIGPLGRGPTYNEGVKDHNPRLTEGYVEILNDSIRARVDESAINNIANSLGVSYDQANEWLGPMSQRRIEHKRTEAFSKGLSKAELKSYIDNTSMPRLRAAMYEQLGIEMRSRDKRSDYDAIVGAMSKEDLAAIIDSTRPARVVTTIEYRDNEGLIPRSVIGETVYLATTDLNGTQDDSLDAKRIRLAMGLANEITQTPNKGHKRSKFRSDSLRWDNANDAQAYIARLYEQQGTGAIESRTGRSFLDNHWHSARLVWVPGDQRQQSSSAMGGSGGGSSGGYGGGGGWDDDDYEAPDHGMMPSDSSSGIDGPSYDDVMGEGGDNAQEVSNEGGYWEVEYEYDVYNDDDQSP